jgi:predicted HD phosphohydrolase
VNNVEAKQVWQAMPPKPTLVDFFERRFNQIRNNLPFPPGHHVIQCASLAMKAGQPEETVLACLLHDLGLWLIKPDHGWWGAQLVEPYVSEKVAWAIRYHQALRFYPDASVGYEYPEMYLRMFGPDYRPSEHIEAAYRYAKDHRWYMEARLITLYDDYSFDRALVPSIEPFLDIIGRHFKQPEEGLGRDNSPVAHMWRTISDPDRPV